MTFFFKSEIKIGTTSFTKIKMFDHGSTQHCLVLIRAEDKSYGDLTTIYHQSNNMRVKTTLTENSIIIANNKHRLLASVGQLSEGQIMKIDTVDPNDSGKVTTLLVKKCNTTFRTILYRQETGWSLNDWYKYLQLEQNFTTVVDIKILNDLVLNALVREPEKQNINTLTSEVVMYVKKAIHSTSAEESLPVLTEIYATVLDLTLRLTEINNSVLMDAVRKAKSGQFTEQRSFFRDLFCGSATKHVFNKCFGTNLSQGDSELMINTNTADITFKSKISPILKKVGNSKGLNISDSQSFGLDSISQEKIGIKDETVIQSDNRYDPARLLISNCVSEQFLDDFKIEKRDHPNDQYDSKYPYLKEDVESKEVLKHGCTKQHHPSALMLLPKSTTNPHYNAIIYHSCPLTAAGCARRVLTPGPLPSLTIVREWKQFCAIIVYPKIQSLLDSYFDYDVRAWYNFLNRDQQKEVKGFIYGIPPLEPRPYDPADDNFIKSEPQLRGDKIRQIAGPSPDHKFVVGPTIKPLDKVLSRLGGWAVGKSYEDKEKMIQGWLAEFNMSVTTDISGLDQSHNAILKYIWTLLVDYLILSNKIHHVEPEIYREYMTKEFTHMNYDVKDDDGSMIRVAVLKLKEKLGSGQGYTTDINTLLVRLLLWFIAHRNHFKTDSSTSGDDSVAAYDSLSKEQIVKAYSEVFTPKGKEHIPHGLGVTLKYMRIGDIADITPCSTEVFVCKCGPKVVRQLERFCKFTGVAQKALGLKPKELDEYCTIKMEGEAAWGGTLPIIRAYIAKIGNRGKYGLLQKKGKPKETVEYDKKYEIYYKPKKTDHDFKEMIFGKDYAYTYGEREHSLCSECPRSYQQFLFDKYNLTENDIKMIENQIALLEFGKPFDTTLLDNAFDYRNKYLTSINYEPLLDEATSIYNEIDNIIEIPFYLMADSEDIYPNKIKSKANNWNNLRVYLQFGNSDNSVIIYKEILKDLYNRGMIQSIPLVIENEYFNVRHQFVLQTIDLKILLNEIGIGLDQEDYEINYIVVQEKIFTSEILERVYDKNRSIVELPEIDFDKPLEDEKEVEKQIIEEEKEVEQKMEQGEEVIDTKFVPEKKEKKQTYHKHKCVDCKRIYVHEHPFKHVDHEQDYGDCPYEDCSNHFALFGWNKLRRHDKRYNPNNAEIFDIYKHT